VKPGLIKIVSYACSRDVPLVTDMPD